LQGSMVAHIRLFEKKIKKLHCYQVIELKTNI